MASNRKVQPRPRNRQRQLQNPLQPTQTPQANPFQTSLTKNPNKTRPNETPAVQTFRLGQIQNRAAETLVHLTVKSSDRSLVLKLLVLCDVHAEF